jgi:PEP-CTERM motif
MLKTFVALTGLALASSAVAATDPIYTYSYNGTGIPAGGYGTNISSWTASYDSSGARDLLSLSVSMGHQDVTNDGFWFVLNAGGNPKGIANELPIFFGDIANNRVTAYVYDGANAASSWSTQRFLGSFANAFTTSGSNFNFTLDVTNLNALNLGANWKGAGFSNDIGIWYHPFDAAQISYNNMGKISALGFGNSGYFDTGAMHTTKSCRAGSTLTSAGLCATGNTTNVPEPGSLAILGLGFIGVGYATRRRRAA